MDKRVLGDIAKKITVSIVKERDERIILLLESFGVNTQDKNEVMRRCAACAITANITVIYIDGIPSVKIEQTPLREEVKSADGFKNMIVTKYRETIDAIKENERFLYE